MLALRDLVHTIVNAVLKRVEIKNIMKEIKYTEHLIPPTGARTSSIAYTKLQ